MMRTPVVYLLLLCLSAAPVFGQDGEAELVRKVDHLLMNAQFAEAIALLENYGATSRSIVVENKMAEALTRNGNFEAAEELLKAIGEKVDAQPDGWLKAMTRSNLGFLQLNQGRNDLAEESLQEALHLFEDAGRDETPEAAQAFAQLGIVYMSQGKYAQAQEQLHRALTLRQAGGAPAGEYIAATYNDLGLAYSQTDKGRALDYYEQARKLYVTLYGDQHAKIAIATLNMGIVYRDLELYGDAVNNFEAALKIADAVYPQPHPTRAIALYNLGQTYLKLRDRKTAMTYYEKAKKMYEDCYGPRHPETASVLNAIGNLQLADGQYEAALRTYQKALQANVPSFHDDALTANPPLKDYYHGTRLLHTLLFKAQAFESRYTGKSLKFNDLAEAMNILTRCDSLIDQLRQQSTNESDKLLLGVMANEVYTDGVRIAFETGLNALHKDAWFRKAFYFAEKSKSAVLLESISESNAKTFAGIPPELLEEENNLKSALTLTAQKLAGKPGPEEEKLFREHAFALKRKYEAFIRKLEGQFPSYFNLKFNAAAPSIEQLQKLLDGNTALLSYFIDEKNTQLYIFVIRQDQFRVVQRRWSADLDKYITGLRNSLYFNELATFRESAAALGNALVPPLPASVTELVILPAGKLGLVPFETLLTGDAHDISDYPAMPFLLRQFGIRYEFSAGLLLQKARTTTSTLTPSIFLCAPVSFQDREFLADLPGTEREVADIAQLFRDRNLTSALFTGPQADERQIKSGGLEDYHFLHFATHGVVDESNPELSRIFLQPNGRSEDGDLFAGEIYNLRLNADLVTLSACQTGLGKVQKGEGVIGLSRALVYAGAQNLMVSFWNVADESTALLMKDFYSNILGSSGDSYCQGLRKAKLKLLNSPTYAAPFYWAPFVLIGF